MEIYGRVGHLNYRTQNTGLIKLEGTKYIIILLFELSFQRPTFPFILGMTGGDTEPEMTDPTPPEIPHVFGLRISLGSMFS